MTLMSRPGSRPSPPDSARWGWYSWSRLSPLTRLRTRRFVSCMLFFLSCCTQPNFFSFCFFPLRELLFFFSFSMIAWKPCLTWIDLSTLCSCTGLCFLCTYAHQRNNLAPQFLSFSWFDCWTWTLLRIVSLRGPSERHTNQYSTRQAVTTLDSESMWNSIWTLRKPGCATLLLTMTS